MSRLPLEGITVVSFEQAVAAPFATRQLADLGARVIKIERDTGDFARGYDSKVRGMASYFVWLNRSKESVVLDLKSPEGMQAARTLIERADIFVQNLAPGAVERMGLGPADALALNPRLIHVSISGYGASGPYRNKKAYDLLVQCEAGLLSVTGTRDQPSKVGISIADIAAGMYAYTGALTALIQRGVTGEGQRIEVSMLEALAEWMGHPYFYSEYGGSPPPRTGSAHATIAPYGPYDCADGTVFLAVQNEREWERFCRDVVSDAALTTDPRFAGNAARVDHRADLDAILTPALRVLSRTELIGKLDTAAIANAELRDMAGLSRHPQLEARGRWRDVDSPVGALRTLTPPVTADWETRMDPVPAVGAHTARVLAELALPARGTNA